MAITCSIFVAFGKMNRTWWSTKKIDHENSLAFGIESWELKVNPSWKFRSFESLVLRPSMGESEYFLFEDCVLDVP